MGKALINKTKLNDIVSVKDFGAVGDGVTDDTAALNAAVAYVNTAYAAGKKVLLYAPAGSYAIGAVTTKFAQGVPGGIVGDGTHRTYFQLKASFSGDLFAWSEAWQRDVYANGFLASADKAGARICGITVIGNSSNGNVQNAFMFYDRNDYVFMQDVEAFYLNGQFFSCGRTLNMPQAYMRESYFANLRVFSSGTLAAPAVEISSTTQSGSDATNELQFHSLNIFASAGKGLVVSNPNNFNSTRLISFYQLRSENNGGDAVSLGLSTDNGYVSSIGIYGLELPDIKNGTTGLVINTAGSSLPYAIVVEGLNAVASGTGNGIAINAGFQISVGISNLTVSSGVPIQLGSKTNSVSFTQAGRPFTSGVSSTMPTPLSMYSPVNLYGLAGSGDRVGFAAMKGSGSTTSAIRLTMDAATANTQNCFNAAVSAGYTLAIQVVALSFTTGRKAYSWSVPVAYFDALYGVGAATLVLGTPATATVGVVTGASVSCTADTTNGGLNISFTPPTGNTDTWNVSAAISFVRSS